MFSFCFTGNNFSLFASFCPQQGHWLGQGINRNMSIIKLGKHGTSQLYAKKFPRDQLVVWLRSRWFKPIKKEFMVLDKNWVLGIILSIMYFILVLGIGSWYWVLFLSLGISSWYWGQCFWYNFWYLHCVSLFAACPLFSIVFRSLFSDHCSPYSSDPQIPLSALWLEKFQWVARPRN